VETNGLKKTINKWNKTGLGKIRDNKLGRESEHL
jgi:hypothetical protein